MYTKHITAWKSLPKKNLESYPIHENAMETNGNGKKAYRRHGRRMCFFVRARRVSPTHPDVDLRPVVLPALKQLGGGVGRAAAPRLQQTAGPEVVTEAKVCNAHRRVSLNRPIQPRRRRRVNIRSDRNKRRRIKRS